MLATTSRVRKLLFFLLHACLSLKKSKSWSSFRLGLTAVSLVSSISRDKNECFVVKSSSRKIRDLQKQISQK